MKILITGGAGFVASHLVDYCLSQGDEVIVTVRWNEDLSRLTNEVKKRIHIEFVELTDLSSVIRCINKHGPEVISHLAAQSWVPYSLDNPIYTIKNNVESTLNILEAVRMMPSPKPLTHICSSSEFYGRVKREDLPITEDHSANPGNPYGVSKVAGDFLSQLYAECYDLPILTTRMFTHCGVRRTMMSAENFYAKSIAELEKSGGNIIEVSDEKGMSSIRTWADVRDAVKAYHKLFKARKTGVYNIAGETVKTIQEVLDHLISISNLEYVKFKENPKFFRKVDVDKQVVDISKFKGDIEWTPEISFEDLMKDLLNYWRGKV